VIKMRRRGPRPGMGKSRALVSMLGDEVVSGRFDVVVTDPYPPRFSHYESTHFHHFIPKRR
jgi:hypothetical protein